MNRTDMLPECRSVHEVQPASTALGIGKGLALEEQGLLVRFKANALQLIYSAVPAGVLPAMSRSMHSDVVCNLVPAKISLTSETPEVGEEVCPITIHLKQKQGSWLRIFTLSKNYMLLTIKTFIDPRKNLKIHGMLTNP